MPIPDFQTIMLPLLEYAGDGNEYKLNDSIQDLAVQFGLTEEEKTAKLPSGRSLLFNNRVGWAKTHLVKAGLLLSTRHSYFKISETGRKLLSQNPSKISVSILKEYPTYLDFIKPNGKEEEENDTIINETPLLFDPQMQTATPEEIIENEYQTLRRNLAKELLDKVLEQSPTFFEQLVVELLVKMGYGGSFKEAGMAIGRTGDEGIDGTIKEDRLGLDVIYIQAKRWKVDNVVGRPQLQQFIGALAGQGAKKGIFITTSRFTTEAKNYRPITDTKVVLIDGDMLCQLMIDYNLGVSTKQTYEVKKLDYDYFDQD